MIERKQKKPRKTATNRRHLETVWGPNFIRTISIPRIIDDYNHWMLGVDKADQLIAYYQPKLCCCRTWMPLMFHALDVAHVNAFVACNALGWR